MKPESLQYLEKAEMDVLALGVKNIFPKVVQMAEMAEKAGM
jgi:hypothetical protein